MRKWRAQVPEGFEFTVRANRKLTHETHLKPTKENFQLFERMLEISEALEASVLHFQFPSTFEVTKQVVADWRDFLDSAPKPKSEGLHYAFEIRNQASANSEEVMSFLAENDIIPTTDASKNKVEPSIDSKVVYTRVFGHGDHTQWSFDSDELAELKERVESIPARRRFVTFHNITMYEDASRMRALVKGSTDHQILKSLHGTCISQRSAITCKDQFPSFKGKTAVSAQLANVRSRSRKKSSPWRIS